METDPNIGSFIVVLIGALTALIAGGVTAYKTVRETDSKVEETKSLVRRAELELDLKAVGVKTDVSEKIQDIYGQLTEDFNKKLLTIREEMKERDEKYQKEIVVLQDQITKNAIDREALIKELDTSRKSEKVKTEAGIMLINAIEQSLELRREAAHQVDNCKACTISDKALMKILNEVKILFQNNVDST